MTVVIYDLCSSPYLTHLSDWVSGEIIEIEDNPYKGTVISAKDDMGRIFWGEADYFTMRRQMKK